MLNFNELQPTVDEAYSFVGIAKEGNSVELHLPRGYTASAVSTYNQKRDLFFSLYRIMRQFKAICVEKGYLNPDQLRLKTSDRDGVLRGEEGATTTTGTDEPLIFYAKLDMVGALLDAYDELKIAALVYRLRRTENLDYSHLHRFIHQGIFLSNGNIYVDTMTLPRPQVQFESTDIVAMYCYLVWEVKTRLGDEVSSEVKSLSEQFRQHYLGIELSLFNEQDYEIALNELKDALDTIDHHTPLKDEDYYTFYEAIEHFLYGKWQLADDGNIWGINNFHMVWESMCLTYLAKTTSPDSLSWLDRQFLSDSALQQVDAVPKVFDLLNAFECNGRKLRPDAVVFPSCTRSTTAKTVYSLSRRTWDDFGFWTTFYASFIKTREIKIAYVDQPTGYHTINELKKFYTHDAFELQVGRPLRKKFYSYWPVEEIDWPDRWSAMMYFNHIYSVAIKQSIWTFKGLKDYLKNSLGVERFDYNSPNVLEASLLRSVTWDSIQAEFSDFIKQVFQFEIIDIKYHDASYFQDKNNQEDLKSRSVRKQFVYEYLLQESIKGTVGIKDSLRVHPSFVRLILRIDHSGRHSAA